MKLAKTAFLITFISILTCCAAAQSKPNILLIMADDLGYSDLGCYGGEIQTPNLDRLASNGLRYTQSYNTSRCWPTRSALMTGYYPQQINIDPRRKPGIPDWALCLPQRLKPAGYRSYLSGKWHVIGVKPKAGGGFDETYVMHDHDRNFYPQRFEVNDEHQHPVKKGTGYYSTTAYADHAIQCLKDHAKNHNNQPFFSYLAFTVPHFPLHAPAEDIKRYQKRYSAGWGKLREERIEKMHQLKLLSCGLSKVEPKVGPPYKFPGTFEILGPNEVNRPLPWDTLTEGQKKFQADKMAVHAAMVDRMDQEIGRVLEQVRSMKALDNTLIIFLSDNGCSAEIMVRGDGHNPDAAPGSAESYLCVGPGWSNACNTPFRKHKTWVHEGGCCTPFIVHWPSQIKASNELRNDICHVVDIVPTLLDIAGVKTESKNNIPALPGKSIVPTFNNPGALKDRGPIFFSHEGNRALRIGDYKLVSAKTHGNDQWELYNLAKDRSECNNLAATQPERVKEMAEHWQKLTDLYDSQGQ
ncbi:MAG: arylsulfatase [Kiritimatiellae bacterium]|jgi:arylsulfatase A-like enzyme|nr:arylsulfatase [Kiritimatiellia bacterium]